jgi:hypothetical protein
MDVRTAGIIGEISRLCHNRCVLAQATFRRDNLRGGARRSRGRKGTGFGFPIDEYRLACSGSDDVKLQNAAIALTADESIPFSVHVSSWKDLAHTAGQSTALREMYWPRTVTPQPGMSIRDAASGSLTRTVDISTNPESNVRSFFDGPLVWDLLD